MTVKVPLAARIDLRDTLQAKIPELEARLQTALGVPTYTFDPNVSVLYPHALAKGYNARLGQIALAYFTAGVAALEHLAAADGEAATAVKAAAGQNAMRLAPSDDVLYAGVRFKDGTVEMVYAPEWLGVNTKFAGDELVKELDMKLVESGELSYSIRRSIQQDLDPFITHFEKVFQELFSKSFTAEYDVGALFAAIKATYLSRDGDEKWFAKWPRYVPERLGRYYATLADTLEKEKFGTDKDLREAFTEAVGSGVVRFELVDELPKGRTYHAVVLKDGSVSIQTTVEHFGRDIASVGEDVEDQL